MDTKRELAVQKWERRSTIPLSALALVYLALYAFEGRAIAVLLMLSGLALVSIITVSFASWFLDRLNIEVTTKQRKN